MITGYSGRVLKKTSRAGRS